jgi:hypothetical protein
LANTKISDLTDGAPAVGTDVLPVARAGANRRLTVANLFASPTITGTVTAAQVTGIETVVAKWGVPVILASSGTMGNNGAVSAMTALPATYAGGAWLYLPAGAVAAGVPATAAFRWFVGSSTTAGTVYDSTWDGSGIPPMGTATPYVTTGPGAFTGIAAGEIVVATVTIPAGAMGPNGYMDVDFGHQINTAAGNKTPRIRLSGAAGTVLTGAALSTTNYPMGRLKLSNLGLATRQRAFYDLMAAGGVFSAVSYANIDTTVATTLVFSLEKATATNHVLFEDVSVRIGYGA